MLICCIVAPAIMGRIARAQPAPPPSGVKSRPSLVSAAALVANATRATDPAERTRFISEAETAYAALTRDFEKSGGDAAARFRAARCRVAHASVIFRLSLAGALDEYERSSGLSAVRDAIRPRLDQAIALYRAADAALRDLSQAAAADEEKFLILGIAADLPVMTRECSLNLAWALLWRGALDSPDPATVKPLSESLKRFDALLSEEAPPAEQHGVYIGSAVALRLLQRYDDAIRVLDRLKEHAQPDAAAVVRVEYERGRTLMSQERFQESRETWARLIDAPQPSDLPATRFYLDLAPVLLADCDLLEALKLAAADAETAARLRKRGADAIAALMSRGGPWPAILRSYLAARSARRSPAEQSAAELVLDALAAMRAEKMAEARSLWKAALDKLPPGRERVDPLFNYAVCLLRTDAAAEAADRFEEVARLTGDRAVGARALELAYRARLTTADASRTAADYAGLARACENLLQLTPDHAQAAEVRWVRAVALQEAGRPAEAQEAYDAVPAESPRYWEARRNALRCRQRAIADSSARGGSPEAHAALAEAWLALAGRVDAARGKGDERAGEALALDARLAAIEVLAAEPSQQCDRALSLVADLSARGGLTDETRGRLLSIRIRCHRRLNQFEQAAAVVNEFIQTVPPEQAGETLLGLAAAMEAEIRRLETLGRADESQRMAASALPTLRELLAWIEKQPDRQVQVGVVQLSLLRVLEQAGRLDEALQLAETLRAADPRNGALLTAIARLTEVQARAASGAAAAELRAKSEKAWGELLSDPALRETSPEVYWEARWRWLRLRLEGGHAAEVVKAIESEQAWYPALGGAPWQGRLKQLAEQARAAAATP